MTNLNEIYKCNVCGNMVEVLHTGIGTLVCCGQPMELLKEITNDTGLEKHVPVIEETDKGVKIKIGSIPHPMEEKHFIEWIEVITQNKIARKKLSPGQPPEADFKYPKEAIVKVRIYCNVHGLWRNT